MVHKPDWFKDDEVFVSYAPTVGINKDGDELYVVDVDQGVRTTVIDDQLERDVEALLDGGDTSTSRWVPREEVPVAVPVYFDDRPLKELHEVMDKSEMAGLSLMSIKEMEDRGWIETRNGHGSPSADLRNGTIPYIKVSDIRAGQININPTNRVTRVVAEKHWRGSSSGLHPWDLVTPIRTSKNIGEFALLMPGQEHIVLTKEVLVLHATEDAPFDNFYLLWCLTLKAVRRQWDRIVFMQTNREDVGSRYFEIQVPVSDDPEKCRELSQVFREYYQGVFELRAELIDYLAESDMHHMFISTDDGAPLATEE